MEDFVDIFHEQTFTLDLTGENADKLLQFKRWFWSIVEKMSMTERQDLVSLLSVALFLKYTFGKTN